MPGVYTASGKGDDYGRTERQRLVMQAIVKKAKTKSPTELIEMAQIVMPSIKTDLTKKQIYTYVLETAKMGTTEVHQFALPVEGSFTSQTINGQDCLVPDLAVNSNELKKFLFNS